MEEPKSFVLEFKTNPDDGDRVLYSLNQKFLGEGDEGFNLFLQELKNLPSRSQVMIRYPFFVSRGGGSFPDTLPFRHRQQEFDEIVNQKNINVVYQMG